MSRAFWVIFLLLILLSSQFGLHAEELERDRCSCKLAMKGSESTLKGGTCVRTESSSTCLMEWGGGSTSKLSQGKGLSQSAAEIEYLKDSKFKFDIPRLGPSTIFFGVAPAEATLLQTALANLSLVPPDEYAKVPGIPESFMLAAGSALFRYSKSSLGPLTTDMLQTNRDKLIFALQKEGEFTYEQFVIRAHTGCLQVNDRAQGIQVYVKTPFAISEGC